MISNDILRSLRHLLGVSDQKMVEILQLAGPQIPVTEMATYLKKEEEPGFQKASDKILAHFLQGLILHQRGVDPERPLPPVEWPISNNVIFKKLRVAFQLKDEDILNVLGSVGFPMTKSELSAFFRREDHKNYRPCGDQLLRNFLKGLHKKYEK